MLLNCGVGEDSWESLGLQGDPTSPLWRRSGLVVHWKDWCWSWNSNTLATWCRELIHLKRPWCWERLRAGGEGDDRGWDGWMASPTQWTWVGVNSGSWWWTGRPGMLLFMGSQRVGHDWATELKCGTRQFTTIHVADAISLFSLCCRTGPGDLCNEFAQPGAPGNLSGGVGQRYSWGAWGPGRSALLVSCSPSLWPFLARASRLSWSSASTLT